MAAWSSSVRDVYKRQPVTQLDLVSKYIGGGEDQERARLNKLGGTEWAKQKTRAKKAAKDLAKGLIELYAQRQRQPGFAFSPDSTWQREFEEAFPYAETDDQLRAVAEIKADMERPRPMDRLLCGDVGYGKTVSYTHLDVYKRQGFRLAPPISPPSMSGWESSSAAFLAFMEPPY